MRTIAFLLLFTLAASAQTTTPTITVGPNAPVTPAWLSREMASVPACRATTASLPPSPHTMVADVDLSQGAVTKVSVVTSSGNPAFDQKAVQCLQNLPTTFTTKIVGDLAMFVPLTSDNGAVVPLSDPSSSTIALQLAHANAITVQHDTASPMSARAPSAAGYRHSCDENDYPVAALQTMAGGETLLAFTITPQGDVTDIAVRRSSGRSDLDDAAVACAKHWLYPPAVKNGAAVASQHLTMVHWELHPDHPFGEIANAAQRCVASTDAGRSELAQAVAPYTVTKVHFSNGVVTDATTVGRSNSADLDRRTRECFRTAPKELTAAVANDTDHTFVSYSATANAMRPVALSPLVCPVAYYPPEAIRLEQTGQTTVVYGISTSGDLKDVRVEKSSGYKLLDDAAVLCAQQSWHYKPATRNGLPIESISHAIVKWALEDPARSPADIQATAPNAIPQTQNCVAYYPPKSVRLNEEGDVQLQFTIAADGTVRDAAVINSSGHDLLDQAAVACVTQWHYKPALQNGTPVAVSRQTIVRYRLSGGSPPVSETTPDAH